MTYSDTWFSKVQATQEEQRKMQKLYSLIID